MPVQLTAIDITEAAFVARVASHVRPGAGEAAFVGEGSNNWVHRLGAGDDAVVVKLGKPHRVGFAAREHAKEHWCAAMARTAGVPTPQSLAVGAFEGRSYQVQAFSPGRPPRPEDEDRAWAAMGRWARAFHAIPVAGWGPQMSRDGVFQDDWPAHLRYNIEALTPDDSLRELGVLDAGASADLKRRFERLAATPFKLGLSHGDLSMHNILVDEAGEPLALIDWGSAGAFPVPHYELNEIIRADRATRGHIDIFRRAYGLSDAAFTEVMADLPDLAALRDIDTLRWGLAHAPDQLDMLTAYARRALSRLHRRRSYGDQIR